jgi:uncharacterized protein (TIGR03790 family)
LNPVFEYLKNILFLIIALLPLTAKASPGVFLPNTHLQASQLAVIVNDDDPDSIATAAYYQQRRQIPQSNIIHIRFQPGKTIMQPGEFAVLKKQVDAQTPEHIQAYVLTWAAPYRVGCLSITSAFAFGYDENFCTKGCNPTQINPYSGSASLAPYDDFNIRPTMMLAAQSVDAAKALIDRGVAADGSWPDGSAYLVSTNDKIRSVRRARFPLVDQQLSRYIPVHQLETQDIANKQNVMFYFTGAVFVKNLETNHYLPGAIADHLTSSGGRLTDSRQMSALRWLESGVTGSYGTVVEPCNLLPKFPDPLIAMTFYLNGATLIESYWKSVLMPGQGVFIGEPLASPYAAYRLEQSGELWRINSPQLLPGYYDVYGSKTRGSGYKLLASAVTVLPGMRTISIGQGDWPFYKIERRQ